MHLLDNFDFWIDFDAPRYLVLLLLLPLFWMLGHRSMQGLGWWRQNAALILRLAVATMLVVALAEPNWLTLMRRLTVLFVVDASDSIEDGELTDALKYVNAAAQQRDAERGDRAGVVVFGREAGIEIPPVDHAWHLARIESELDARHTNLESALALAKATFPDDTAKRVVIVSDGNENTGRAKPVADELLSAGIGIDSVPISYERRGDVRIEKVVVPSDVRSGTPFTLGVVLENLRPDRNIAGKLRITRTLGEFEQLVAEEPIVLEPGKKRLTLRQELREAGISTYEARFTPDNPADDVHSENNVATGFSRVGGKGHVLLIEDASQAGRFDNLVQRLRQNEIDVTVRDTRRPFNDLADLQQYDLVIMADVARVSGDENELTQFTDEQIRAIVQNTEHFGCGLLVLGGPNSYGAGGWKDTDLEKALPVDCEVDNAKIDAVGALMLVIDSSGSMTGPKLAWSKAAAIATSKLLGKRDYLGVVTFDSEAHWIVPLQRNGLPLRTQAKIDRLGAGGGTNMMPALEQAYREIQGVNASIKHVIVLTDGQTPRDNFAKLVTTMRQRDITTTGVAVGRDADKLLLDQIARPGGGKSYRVLSPNGIPRIFMKEARRVAMPLIFEDSNGIEVRRVGSSELLGGMAAPPPTLGYVLTTLKQNSLVEVQLATPRQLQPNSTILATWQYGLGRSAALTTDIGERWAASWPAWAEYEKFLLQLVRWTMRSHDMNDRLALSADVRDGNLDVVVNALDHETGHTNYLQLLGTLVQPDGTSQSFSLEQVAPGRYTTKLPAADPGNYYLSISSGGRTAPLRAAIGVPATAELDNLFSYEGFLAELAEGVPKGGKAGKLIQSPRGIGDTNALVETNVFREDLAPAKSRESMWPLVLFIASVAFLGDVFCRRVTISFDWVHDLRNKLARHGEVADATKVERMERLKSTKANATARYDAGTRMDIVEPIVQANPVTIAQREERSASTASPELAEDPAESPDFTSRLLDAKRREQERHSPKDGDA